MSLAYIDKEYDYLEIQQRVQNLISDEMQTMKSTRSQYLAHLAPISEPFQNNELLQKELKRVAAGIKLDAIDQERYLLPKPDDIKNIPEWKRSLKNAMAQLEHQANHLLNVEVAESKSAAVWLHNNKSLESVDLALTKHIEEARARQNKINLKRKSNQDDIVSELIRNKFQRQDILLKCSEIYSRCELLESQASSL